MISVIKINVITLMSIFGLALDVVLVMVLVGLQSMILILWQFICFAFRSKKFRDWKLLKKVKRSV